MEGVDRRSNGAPRGVNTGTNAVSIHRQPGLLQKEPQVISRGKPSPSIAHIHTD